VPPHNIDKLLSGAVTYEVTPNTNASVYLYRQGRHFDPMDGCTFAQDANNRLYIPTSIPVEHWYCNDPKHSNGSLTDQFAVATLDHTFANTWTLTGNVAQGKSSGALDYVYAFGPAGAYGLAPTDIYIYAYRNRTETNVVTANLSLGGKFDLFERTHQFFAALEYQDQERHQYHWASQGLGTLNMFKDGGKGVTPDGAPIATFSLDDYVSDRNAKNKALRGSFQTLLNLAARLDVLAGVLVQKTDLESQNFQVSRPSPVSGFKETDTLGRLGITYGLVSEPGKWLKNAKTYVSYSEGFQPNVGLFDAAGNALTAPQTMKSYEVGLKTQWLDGNVDAGLALFHSFVTNVPRSVYGKTGDSAGSGFSSVLGGKNTFDGIELEVLGEVLPGWNASLAYTYLKTKIEQPLFSYNLAVANVPRQQAALITSYEFLKGSLKGFIIGASLIRKADSPLVDSASTIFAGNYDPTNQLLNSQTRVDFRASYKGFTGALKGLEVFGNIYNAFDSKFYYSINGTPAFTDTIARPRSITFGAHYKF
jgi:outer membrane receptor for ferric coprogen and ferric-rhodotorulic acid